MPPSWRNSPINYGAISRSLHWLMALLVFVMLGLGWGRNFAPGPWKPVMMQAHTGTGISLLFLLAMRIFWRLYNRPPRLIESLSPAAKLAAHAMHWVLYIMLFMMPFSGWIMVSAMGRQPSFFGLFDLPPLVRKTPSLVPLLKEFHSFMAYGFSALIIMHMAAALLHHFVYRDETLARMWPPLRKEPFASFPSMSDK